MLSAYRRMIRLSILTTSIAFCPARDVRIIRTVANRTFKPETDQFFPSDDDDKRVRLPYFKYGFRTEPFEWEELVKIIAVDEDLAKLSRSVEQQKDYEIYRRELLKEWKTVVDHVLVSKFPSTFEKRHDPEVDRYVAHPPIEEAVATVEEPQQVLVPNDFPYYTQTGIEHWVLWKLGGECSDEDIQKAIEELKERFGDDIICWVNPPGLKSLPEIDHVHFLGKLQDNVVSIENDQTCS